MPIPVNLVGYPGGGSLCFHLDSAASTNASIIKVGGGCITGWFITNTNAAARYIVFHDQNSLPVAGQKVNRKYGIPGGGASNVPWIPGLQFQNGICLTTVANPIDSDATAVALHDLIINIEYV